MQQIEQHLIFAAFCAAVMLLLVRLIVRERVTLQSSLAFLAMLFAMLAISLFPDGVFWLAGKLGFILPSNFLFAAGIGGLVLLNVATLIMVSRTELRSIALTQELGLLKEKLDRLARSQGKDAE
jgi:uncharacterized protein DUF2304